MPCLALSGVTLLGEECSLPHGQNQPLSVDLRSCDPGTPGRALLAYTSASQKPLVVGCPQVRLMDGGQCTTRTPSAGTGESALPTVRRPSCEAAEGILVANVCPVDWEDTLGNAQMEIKLV